MVMCLLGVVSVMAVAEGSECYGMCIVNVDDDDDDDDDV